MYTHGVDPKLDFSNLPELTKAYERLTRMSVYARQPYTGQLVFAAFSGSHQDAIAKGMHWREEKHPEHWNIPYLPIDPHDVGREYESDVIRINSQSGKRWNQLCTGRKLRIPHSWKKCAKMLVTQSKTYPTNATGISS